MLDQVRATIGKYRMFKPGDRILIGVSGGPDSVALVHALHNLADELRIILYIAHLNHCFRGSESAEDAEFVRRFADRLGLHAEIRDEDVAAYASARNMSAQTAAREIRYRFFSETARSLGCNKLATGHNANDQAETVLYHFLRGAGPTGLGGIPPVRDGWVTRPLIEVSRALIEKYCMDNNLLTRLDSSNLKKVYTRNRIRLELIPLLEKEYNNNLVETLVRTSEIFREEEAYLETVTKKYFLEICLERDNTGIWFNTDKFLKIPWLFQSRLIRYGWSVLTGSEQNIAFVHHVSAVDLIRSGRAGSALDLPDGVRLEKSYNKFGLLKDGKLQSVSHYSYILKIPGITVISETGETIIAEEAEGGLEFVSQKRDEIAIDLDKVSLPLVVRSRRQGDRFSPAGFKGSKKLKKYFIDCKIPRRDRERYPVLVTSEGQVIWIAGLRADRR